MPRTRKGAGSGRESQEVKSVNNEVKRLNKQARELLKKAGKDIRQVRHEVSQLKKVGLVSKRVDVPRYLPSKYMLGKLRRNADVLAGEVIAVKAPKAVRQKYVEKGLYEQRGSTLIVPREAASQRARISRGLVEVSRTLAWGEEIRLVLPFKATDMEGVAHKLQTDPTLDGMKQSDELFGFRLFGHNMNTIGFPTAEELAAYILTHYQHLFSGKNGRIAVKEFQLIRFKARDSQLSDLDEDSKSYSPRRNRHKHEGEWTINRRKKRDAARKKKDREKETPEQRTKRLDEQRIRSAQNRQRKWEES
jgi:hypothetical protein